MKKLLLFTLVITLVACSQNPKQATSEGFEIKKGTNVAHWLSQSERRGIEREQFFTKADVEIIKNMGFDHIRLPIDEEQMWDTNGTRHNEAFLLMENCINWCAEFNIKVIVDLHILRSHHFNVEEKPLWTDPAEQEKFFDLWRDLSKSLKKFPNSLLAYELLNEAVTDDHEAWNNLLANVHSAIRELEPERTIVIGSNQWQSVNTFDVLNVPANDSNIILSFHFYDPMILTHYNAHWTEFKNYQGAVHYPGVVLTPNEFESLPDSIKPVAERWVNLEFDKDTILKMLEQPIRKAKSLGLPLYCGEFGVLVNAPEEDRMNWYRDLIDVFEETGIAYSNWNYHSDEFGLIDKGTRHEELIKIVSGNKE